MAMSILHMLILTEYSYLYCFFPLSLFPLLPFLSPSPSLPNPFRRHCKSRRLLASSHDHAAIRILTPKPRPKFSPSSSPLPLLSSPDHYVIAAILTYNPPPPRLLLPDRLHCRNTNLNPKQNPNSLSHFLILHAPPPSFPDLDAALARSPTISSSLLSSSLSSLIPPSSPIVFFLMPLLFFPPVPSLPSPPSSPLFSPSPYASVAAASTTFVLVAATNIMGRERGKEEGEGRGGRGEDEEGEEKEEKRGRGEGRRGEEEEMRGGGRGRRKEDVVGVDTGQMTQPRYEMVYPTLIRV